MTANPVLAAPPSADETAALIEQAEAARARAAAMEYEWRFTAKHIKEAKEKLAAGDLQAAFDLAARAKREGELAVEQAQTAAQVWMLAAPR